MIRGLSLWLAMIIGPWVILIACVYGLVELVGVVLP